MSQEHLISLAGKSRVLRAEEPAMLFTGTVRSRGTLSIRDKERAEKEVILIEAVLWTTAAVRCEYNLDGWLAGWLARWQSWTRDCRVQFLVKHRWEVC